MEGIKNIWAILRTRASGTLLAVCAFVFLSGYIVGRVLTAYAIPSGPMTLVEDTRPRIPVLKFEGIYNGKLRGSLSGEARVFIGNEYIVPDGSGAFEVPADQFFINYIRVEVPQWAKFVASKKGKKYYPVNSSGGERIVPGNRVYFRSEDEARREGYTY